MDVSTARQALNRSDSVIRRCNTENPILQISNSLFTAEWNSTIGTDMIFKLEEKQLRFVECSDVRLKAEKALVIDNDDKSFSVFCSEMNVATYGCGDTYFHIHLSAAIRKFTKIPKTEVATTAFHCAPLSEEGLCRWPMSDVQSIRLQ
ncbi:hypothetical protein WUBG_00174 [Wuchereria bancrofti]|nr:hypothetical protein WUBG_00174 [Wuchereria bancrofti]